METVPLLPLPSVATFLLLCDRRPDLVVLIHLVKVVGTPDAVVGRSQAAFHLIFILFVDLLLNCIDPFISLLNRGAPKHRVRFLV